MLITPEQPFSSVLKADSGATGHYLRSSEKTMLLNLKLHSTGPTVRLPNHEVMTPNQIGTLPIPTLSPLACKAHVYPSLKSASLLSIGQLCDDDCSALFTKKELKIYNKSNTLILSGCRNQTDGLWDVTLTSAQPPPHTPTHTANIIMRFDKTKPELAQYYHA